MVDYTVDRFSIATDRWGNEKMTQCAPLPYSYILLSRGRRNWWARWEWTVLGTKINIIVSIILIGLKDIEIVPFVPVDLIFTMWGILAKNFQQSLWFDFGASGCSAWMNRVRVRVRRSLCLGSFMQEQGYRSKISVTFVNRLWKGCKLACSC